MSNLSYTPRALPPLERLESAEFGIAAAIETISAIYHATWDRINTSHSNIEWFGGAYEYVLAELWATYSELEAIRAELRPLLSPGDSSSTEEQSGEGAQ